jgi:hypothetical protein
MFNSGHQQLEHETSHGSMSRTRWAIGPDSNEGITVNGHKFGAEDEGAPMLVYHFMNVINTHDQRLSPVLPCLQEPWSTRAHRLLPRQLLGSSRLISCSERDGPGTASCEGLGHTQPSLEANWCEHFVMHLTETLNASIGFKGRTSRYLV